MEENKLINSYTIKNNLKDADFIKLRAGMSKKEILENLGKPSQVELNHKKVLDSYNNDVDYGNEYGSRAELWNKEYSFNVYEEFAGGTREKWDSLTDKFDKNRDRIIYYKYIYNYPDKNEKEKLYQNIYFLDDEVIMLTF